MKELRHFIDTNIFLRALIHDLPKQSEESLKYLSKLSSGKYQGISSSLVLAEIAWTLKSYYQFEKKQIVHILRSIQGVKNLKFVDRQNVNLANGLYSEFPVKYIDALIASIPEIQSGEMTIISYDKDFDRLGVKRLEPHYFL